VTQACASMVFVSYSHKDRRWLDDLRSMLSPLGETGAVQVWWDGKIQPSDEWRKEIEAALSSARVAVLLVSRHFLASDFIAEVELPYLLEAARQHKVKILWLLVSPCLYEHTALKDIQALNDVARPLSSLRGAVREHALKVACQMIAEAAGVHLAVTCPVQRTQEPAPFAALSEKPPVAAAVAGREVTASLLRNPGEIQRTDPWAGVRNQSSNAAEGCARILAPFILVFTAIMLYFAVAFVIVIPLTAIDGLKMEWTYNKALDSLGWGCVLAPLYYSLLIVAYLHGVFIAVKEKDNLKGAKTMVIEVATLTTLISLLSALTYSNFLEQALGVIGSLGSLAVCLFLERRASRYLARREGEVIHTTEVSN
jgi:hypothetical protein